MAHVETSWTAVAHSRRPSSAFLITLDTARPPTGAVDVTRYRGKSAYVFRWKHTVPFPTSIPTRTTVDAHAGQGDPSRNSHASKALPVIESGHQEKSRKISAGRFPIGPGALCAWRPANSARTSSARRVLKHPQVRLTSTLCTSRMLVASLGRIAGIHRLGSVALAASVFGYWRSCSSENGPTQAPPRATANNVTSTLNVDFNMSV